MSDDTCPTPPLPSLLGRLIEGSVGPGTSCFGAVQSPEVSARAGGSSLNSGNVQDAFDSMLRTDYIPLRDTGKLALLADYFVDYLGYLPELLGPTDQLIVGRRGTGKTTLLYRALVECMRSWDTDYMGPARPRTLGVYVDLDKCNSLATGDTSDFAKFERAFASELCGAITEELQRSWPAIKAEPSLLAKIFKPRESRKTADVKRELERLAEILTTGVPRFVDKSQPVQTTRSSRSKATSSTSGTAAMSVKDTSIGVGIADGEEQEEFVQTVSIETTTYELAIVDVMRVIADLREVANIPHFTLYIDEFSALPQAHQLKFTTLLKRLLGNHAGVCIKVCAITDNYTLGSSIILQRDLFELSLDLNSFVERHGSLSGAMTELESLTKRIVTQRLSAYASASPSTVFDAPEAAYAELTRAAMGVPRTMGIVLKQAWSRGQGSTRRRIRRSDLDYGVAYASRAYLNQMTGAAKNGLAIPEHVVEIWGSLMERAIQERRKSPDVPASHFMVVPRHEEKLRFLNMFFLVHLIEEGRTTKKESRSRHLYAFDYGAAQENLLDWGDDKNVIRQQRFVYDDVLEPFDSFYRIGAEPHFRCPKCKSDYVESSLFVAGHRLSFCPKDKTELVPVSGGTNSSSFTEEEIKITGAIRSADEGAALVARQVADDVGCYIQKVAKFGEKLERDGVIMRQYSTDLNRYIYYVSPIE